jgi:hypothetical protein
MPKPSDISDPAYRQAMEQANALLNDGKYLEVVRACADLFLGLLKSRPQLLEGMGMMRPAMMWPRLGVRLVVGEDREPRMEWDRERFSFAEAITYYEFTLEQLIRATRPEETAPAG